jgi:hypothetical protein
VGGLQPNERAAGRLTSSPGWQRCARVPLKPTRRRSPPALSGGEHLRLASHFVQHGGGVAFALHGDLASGRANLAQFVRGQLHVGGREVLPEAVSFGGAGDGHDPRLLREQPGQGDLGGGGAFALGDGGQKFDHRLIGFASVGSEAGHDVAEV